MCGIAGYIGLDKMGRDSEILYAMNRALSHRGPDGAGQWIDTRNGIALGHRRLAILDLSPQGRQPMQSQCGRYVLVFNGEIYNFSQLRQELEAAAHIVQWRGHSDTEVLLAAIAHWGLRKALARCEGMFALALWDRDARTLSLARDRLGEKPLYYGWMGSTFLFASELKGLCAHPAWKGELDRDALALMLRHNYIPAPYSIYKGVFKLLPGTVLELPWHRQSMAVQPEPYWHLQQAVQAGQEQPFAGTEKEAIQHLDTLLRNSVEQQMLAADVPLGAFLSGGVDSATIVAMMQAQSGRPVQTFTIGFHEADYNEAIHARAIARHLGTEHTELYITPAEAMAAISLMPRLYDEPFADESQIPTFLVSQLARQHVTVCLSGDGGDELFGGYQRYNLGQDLWRFKRRLPAWIAGMLAGTLTAIPTGVLDRAFACISPLLARYMRTGAMGDKLHKLAEIIQIEEPEKLYLYLASNWKQPADVVKHAHEPITPFTDRSLPAKLPDFMQLMMFLDTMVYLPDSVLAKLDRASMGVSLEARAPFLNHKVVEFAWRLPIQLKARKGQGKWVLKQVLYQYVPETLMNRPKMGFGIPLHRWLRGGLRDWAEELLAEGTLREQEIFNVPLIRNKWMEHVSGRRDWSGYLWNILMFQAWNQQR